MCRSWQELSNESLLAKFGFDTAENEPCKVCCKAGPERGSAGAERHEKSVRGTPPAGQMADRQDEDSTSEDLPLIREQYSTM